MMTMMMMQRIMETTQRVQKNSPEHQEQKFRFPKRIPDESSRDADKVSESGEEEDELNVDVDVENDDALCPVDLTRRHEKFTSIKPGEDALKTRSDSVCSDVSRSESPRDEDGSPSVVMPLHNRRLAFSVENILDPTKFTGRQAMFGADGVCCWKPQMDATGSSEYDGSEQGKILKTIVWICMFTEKRFDGRPQHQLINLPSRFKQFVTKYNSSETFVGLWFRKLELGNTSETELMRTDFDITIAFSNRI